MDARLQRRVQRYGWDRAVEHYEEHWLARLAPATGRVRVALHGLGGQ